MADTKISEMLEASNVNEDDYVMIVQNGINKKVKLSKVGTGGGGGDTLPIGAVVEWTTDTVPNNWLLCNGQEVSRTYYAELFNAIGTTYGEGDGSTTFNLPDRQGLVAIGAGTHTDSNGETKTFVLGQEYGEYNHTLTKQEMPKHGHGFNLNGDTQSDISQLQLDNWNWRNTYQVTSSLVNPTGGDQSHNNIQPSIATNYIIKAKQSAGTTASVIQEDGTPNETDVYSSEAVQAILTGTVLYENSEGTNDTVNLNDSASNYSHIEIFWSRANRCGSNKLDNPNQKITSLVSIFGGSNGVTMGISTEMVYVNANKIERKYDGRATEYTFNGTQGVGGVSEGISTFNITKVIGYKY